jgi:hypothetical protein
VTSYPAHNRVSRFILDGDTIVPGSETVILELSPLGSIAGHDGGALRFGEDGKLYIATGDAETPRNSQSLATLHGKILRINPDGSIPEDNPFASELSDSLRAIWVFGLRNPYTFAIQPGTGRTFINDVGENDWESIFEGIAGANYGWPNKEGYGTDPQYRNPIFAFRHKDTPCIPIAPCNDLYGGAIIGAAFYNPSQPQYPAEYTGSYFFADYVYGWIKRLDLSTGEVNDVAEGLQAPVDLQVGPDGNLYCLYRGQDQLITENDVSYYVATAKGGIYKYVYTPNQAPIYTRHPATATVAKGQPATFRIAGYGSTPLSYEWQKNGVPIPGATSYILTLSSTTVADDGSVVQCVMKNPFGTTMSQPATLHVIDRSLPAGTIVSPGAGYRYRAGDVVSFAGTADSQDGPLPATALSWQAVFYHNSDTHPYLSSLNGIAEGSFSIPTGYLPFAIPIGTETADNIFYRLYLTVNDSSGLTTTTFRDLHPQTVPIRMETVPYGLGLSLDDQPRTTAFSGLSVVGMQRSVGAFSPQNMDGIPYDFVAWSDGRDAVHDVITPSDAATYRAIFRARQGNSAVPVSDYFRRPELNTNVWTFENPMGDAAVKMNGAGAELSVPGGTPHDIWTNGNQSAHIMQSTPDVDFSAEVKFDSDVTAAYQDQGVIVEQDGANFLRLSFYSDGTQVNAAAFVFREGMPVTLFQQQVPKAKPPYIVRVSRVGNDWKFTWFVNGSSTGLTATTTQPLAVTRIGPYAANNGTTPSNAPAFRAVVDYFVNTANPIQ